MGALKSSKKSMNRSKKSKISSAMSFVLFVLWCLLLILDIAMICRCNSLSDTNGVLKQDINILQKENKNIDGELAIYKQMVFDIYDCDPLETLSVLISNHDMSNDYIEGYAYSVGLPTNNYEDICKFLVEQKRLIYVPEFEYDGIKYGNSFTKDSTILYRMYTDSLTLDEGR